MIHLSKTSKLDGIKSWSLIARDTCPGSINPETNELVPACAGCYAAYGNYRYPNVRTPREQNRDDWKRDEWVADMVAALESESHFRWFDSGDMYALALAQKILEVMRRTPATKHWLPTRMYKFEKFRAVINQMQGLPNVSVRFSSDSTDGTFAPEHGSTIYNPENPAPAGTTPCRAYENGGKCSGCRACWDKTVQTIAYPAHGRVMLAQIKKAA
jgi:hypothetical protein